MTGRKAIFGHRLAALVVTGLLFTGQGASAQESSSGEPPYEQQLMRLSEIFGALHFLRPPFAERPTLRAGGTGWRTSWTRRPWTKNRRRRFIERFNQGYRGFSVAYRECTDAARIAMAQYLSEGETIISDVTSRYGR
ncbi:TIGR02301 family protein [Roseibium salinum]|nr:TIGR02301 family protein [Roseibium salinum]